MTPYRSPVQAKDFHAETREFFRGARVSVTGGSGFIGSHVVEQLLALGARPTVLSRRADPPFLRSVRSDIELRSCDLNDAKQTRAALEGAEIILNVAASVAGIEYNAHHPATIFQDNLQCFFNVIRAAQELKVRRFLVTSSACVYPRHCSIPTPEEEGFEGEPEPTNSGYGWAKRMEEYLGLQYSREFGLSVAIARPYNAYGPRDDFDPETSHVLPALIRKAFLSTDGRLPVWGTGQHSRSFLYVDDFARGLLETAARSPGAEALNLGADEEVTIADAAGLIAQEVSRIRGVALVPDFDPAGLTGQPRRRCDTRKSEAVLGYRARVPFAEGLKKTIEWFGTHENHALPSHP